MVLCHQILLRKNNFFVFLREIEFCLLQWKSCLQPMKTVQFMSRLAKFQWIIRDILDSKIRRARKSTNIILLQIFLQSRYRWPGWKGITVEPCGLWETKWEKLRKGSSENEDFRGWSSIFQKNHKYVSLAMNHIRAPTKFQFISLRSQRSRI